VVDAGSQFFGGDARYAFSILRHPGEERKRARFEAEYRNVDLAALSDFEELRGLRVAGFGTGRNLLEWPSGEFRQHRGDGEIRIDPPSGVALMAPSLDAARAGDPGHSRHEWGPFAPLPLPAHLPVGGQASYRYDPDAIHVESGTFATERTHVAFTGMSEW